ncbi:hypothetical protein HG535_0C03980 [Zygotorulaspora mrakii]|uniref:Biogenesis of lysosome-related organelles complex 1 subunit CNL1 n=1 Tax=Zygotorulaspora mrakii TaxID=42260 RepID=A0A7H9B0Y8_ZYGMR|nr:uncharacterized protein HG535_0C03980 [Zygotorulaspora mrakii]QLG72044.1 hypothetical protein HG535_0C03980 [Zygotorulaspora mrakii]
MSSELERLNSELPADDPLNIDKLSVDYEYLIYKIKDYVQSIELETTQICRKQKELIENDIIVEIIDKNIRELKNILQKCDELENHFDMLDQISIITDAFKERLDNVVKEYKSSK